MVINHGMERLEFRLYLRRLPILAYTKCTWENNNKRNRALNQEVQCLGPPPRFTTTQSNIKTRSNFTYTSLELITCLHIQIMQAKKLKHNSKQQPSLSPFVLALLIKRHMYIITKIKANKGIDPRARVLRYLVRNTSSFQRPSIPKRTLYLFTSITAAMNTI